MAEGAASTLYDFAWCLLNCDATDEHGDSYESSRARVFAQELLKRFEKHFEGQDTSYHVFHDWRESLGENLMDFPLHVIQKSKYVLALFTPAFDNDTLGKLLHQNANLFKSRQASFIPISIDGTKEHIPLSARLSNPVVFQKDYEKDNKNWERLIKCLTDVKALKYVRKKGELTVSSPVHHQAREQENAKRRGKHLEKILSKLSTKLGMEWVRLGIELDFSNSELEQMKANFHRVDHAIFDMLTKWSYRSAKSTELERLKTLKQSLIEVGRVDLSEEMEEYILQLEEEIQHEQLAASAAQKSKSNPPAAPSLTTTEPAQSESKLGDTSSDTLDLHLSSYPYQHGQTTSLDQGSESSLLLSAEHGSVNVRFGSVPGQVAGNKAGGDVLPADPLRNASVSHPLRSLATVDPMREQPPTDPAHSANPIQRTSSVPKEGTESKVGGNALPAEPLQNASVSHPLHSFAMSNDIHNDQSENSPQNTLFVSSNQTDPSVNPSQNIPSAVSIQTALSANPTQLPQTPYPVQDRSSMLPIQRSSSAQDAKTEGYASIETVDSDYSSLTPSINDESPMKPSASDMSLSTVSEIGETPPFEHGPSLETWDDSKLVSVGQSDSDIARGNANMQDSREIQKPNTASTSKSGTSLSTEISSKQSCVGSKRPSVNRNESYQSALIDDEKLQNQEFPEQGDSETAESKISDASSTKKPSVARNVSYQLANTDGDDSEVRGRPDGNDLSPDRDIIPEVSGTDKDESLEQGSKGACGDGAADCNHDSLKHGSEAGGKAPVGGGWFWDTVSSFYDMLLDRI